MAIKTKEKKSANLKKRPRRKLSNSVSFNRKNGAIGRGSWQIFSTKTAGKLIIILEVRDIKKT